MNQIGRDIMKKAMRIFLTVVMGAMVLLPLQASEAMAAAHACSNPTDCPSFNLHPDITDCVNGLCYLNGSSVADGTCTSDDDYKINDPDPPGSGLVSTIVKNIQTVLFGDPNAPAPQPPGISQQMFEAIAGDAGFIKAVQAASTLYVAIYGILFTFGMVQITVYDFVLRLIKIGVIVMLLDPAAWQFFSDTFVTFFNAGTDSIIAQVSNIALDPAAAAAIPANAPFVPLDNAIVRVVSSKMAVTLLATFVTGLYGAIIGLLLLMSLGSFLKAMLNALWVYLMALVMKTLLFGLAPLFIACLLFARTRHLFDGWLNQIINACLQPIFLFTFFSFFVILITACIDQLLKRPVCWTEWAAILRGTPSSEHYWRFAIEDCDPSSPSFGAWVPFDGIWDFSGPVNAPGGCEQPVNPVGIMLPLTLWILCDLASRFNHIVVEIAKDMANGASTDLRMGAEKMGEWFSGAGAGAEAGANPFASMPGANNFPGLQQIGQNLGIGNRPPAGGQMPPLPPPS